jgi:hypothetical protein
MQLEPSDVTKLGTPPIWKDFDKILKKGEGDWVKLTPLERSKVTPFPSKKLTRFSSTNVPKMLMR